MIVNAALWLLANGLENFNAQHLKAGNRALKEIRKGLDRYLRSQQDTELLHQLRQAIHALMPCLNAQALAELNRYFNGSLKDTPL